eukprot:jgi/Botrbrau1/6525/Bobra.0034s0097.1
MLPNVHPMPLHDETLPGQCKQPGNFITLEFGTFQCLVRKGLQLHSQAHCVDARSNNRRIYLCCTEIPQLEDLQNNEEAYELLCGEGWRWHTGQPTP